jgi:hypothetical protein
MGRRMSVLLFCLVSMAVFAQEDFSADVVRLTQDKQPTPMGKIFATKDKLRFESREQNGHQGVMIMNLASQSSAILIPERKMYMDFTPGQGPGAQRTWAFFRPSDIDDACTSWHKMATNNSHWGSCKKIGSETVNGRSTIKYEGTDTDGKTNVVWLDSKLVFPVKWQGQNDGGELQNIKEGSQPSSLFEVPADYQKMQMPAMPNMPQRPQ